MERWSSIEEAKKTELEEKRKLESERLRASQLHQHKEREELAKHKSYGLLGRSVQLVGGGAQLTHTFLPSGRSSSCLKRKGSRGGSCWNATATRLKPPMRMETLSLPKTSVTPIRVEEPHTPPHHF